MAQLLLPGMLGVLAAVILLMAKRSGPKYGPMEGMVVSMYFGMTAGLTAGVFYGIGHQGDLFTSTVAAMVFGVLAGTVCGLCFGLLSVVEGGMAGLMGGMMGAMLGEMIQPQQASWFVQLFLSLAVLTVFLMAMLANPKNAPVRSGKWLLKPFLVLAGSAGYLLVAHSFIPDASKLSAADPEHHASSDVGAGIPAQEITVEAKEMRYSLSSIRAQKNTVVTLTLANLDAVEHDIEIRTDAYRKVGESHDHHWTDNRSLHVHAAPFDQQTIQFEFQETGTYEFYCTIPGHQEQGMAGQFIVS